jgi:Kef-type K+ transport system membrane component KefB
VGIPKIHAWLKNLLGDSILLPFAFSALFLISFIAEGVGLAAIVGAFLIGMVLASTPDHMAFVAGVNPIYVFLAPAFFVVAGLQVNLGAMSDALAFTLIFSALAVVSKLIGCWAGALSMGASWRGGLLMGAGMVPRGEVGLIIALIGKQQNLLDETGFTISAVMALLTTFVAPLLIKPMATAWPEEMKEA